MVGDSGSTMGNSCLHTQGPIYWWVLSADSHEGQHGTHQKPSLAAVLNGGPICFTWLSTLFSKGFSGTNVIKMQETDQLAFFCNLTIIVTQIMIQLYTLMTFTYLLHIFHAWRHKSASQRQWLPETGYWKYMKMLSKREKKPLRCIGCPRQLTSKPHGNIMWVEATCYIQTWSKLFICQPMSRGL